MTNAKERLKKDLMALFVKGADIYNAEVERQKETKKNQADQDNLPLQPSYQEWYTQALPVIKQILPDRYQEFVEQYKLDKRKEIDFLTYTISDYLIGLRVTRGPMKEEVVRPFAAFSQKFQQQLYILKSCLERIDSALSDIQGVLQAELFDDELGAATELSKKGHLRAAGALAGVTLERHFGSVALNHSIKLPKKEPTIADYNDVFRKEGIYDVPMWRFIQRLGDLRNLSVHFKEREPTKEEIGEMIDGAQKVIKTVF